jgi:endonuclease YncB( thermonuclease family)
MNTPSNLSSAVFGVAVGVIGAVACACVLALSATHRDSGVLSGSSPARSALDPPAKSLKDAALSPASFSASAVGTGGGDGLIVIGDRDHARVGVRLWGIDAPELDQPMGRESEAYLRKLVGADKVFVQPTGGADPMGYINAKVYANGKLVNEEMVRAGMAWPWANGSDILVGAQGEARAVRRGIWGTTHPIAPWDWRKGVR